MLILERKIGQSVIIGDDIIITVVQAKGRTGLRLGIDAPDHVSVHREEVYLRIKQQEQEEDNEK